MNLKDIQELIKFVAKSGATDVNLEIDNIKISIKSPAKKRRGSEEEEVTTVFQEKPAQIIATPNQSTEVAPHPVVAANTEAKDELSEKESNYITITASMIGTFYRSSSPETPPFVNIGDTIKVGVKIVEGKRERIQYFEGVCIAKKNRDINSSFTVRKISFGEGVERTFALYSPNVDSIKVIRSGKVRRAKLYYLRDRKGKSARIAEKIKKKIGVDVSVKPKEIEKKELSSTKEETAKDVSDVQKKTEIQTNNKK